MWKIGLSPTNEEDPSETDSSNNGQILGWKELSEELGVYDYFPICRFQDLLATYNGHKEPQITGFDFSGIDLLTDDVVILLSNLCKEKPLSKKITILGFIGCIHLTDYGVEVLVEAFPNLREIHLDACPLLTEASLIHLSKCGNLEIITMTGTNVGSIPQLPEKVKVSLDGCPLIPQASRNESVIEERPPQKLVIIGKSHLMFDIKGFLTSEFNASGENRLTKCLINNMRHTPHVKLKTFEEEFNIFEVHSASTLYHPFLSPRAVYIVALDMNASSSRNPQVTFMNVMNNIKAVSPHNHVILLALNSSENESSISDRLDELGEHITNYFNEQQAFISINVTEEAHTGSDIQQRDFPTQQRYAKMRRVSDYQNSFSLFQVNVETAAVIQKWPKVVQSDHLEKMRSRISELEGIFSNWHLENKSRVADKLSNLNKADLTEIKSFSNPPALLKKCSEAILIILGKKDLGWGGFKKELSDLRFISKLNDFSVDSVTQQMIKKLKSYIDDPDLSTENIVRVSRAGAAMWEMVEFIYKFGTEMMSNYNEMKALTQKLSEQEGKMEHEPSAPSGTKKKIVSNSQMDNVVGQDMILNEIKKAIELQSSHSLPVIPLADTSVSDEVKKVLVELQQEKLVILESVLQKIKTTKDRRVLLKILERLHLQGDCLVHSFSKTDDVLIVSDVNWYMSGLHHLYGHKYTGNTLANDDRCKPLDPTVPLFTREDVRNILNGISQLKVSDSLLDLLLNLLGDQGVLVPIPQRSPLKPNLHGLMFMFCHMKAPVVRRKKEDQSASIIFNQDHWPPKEHRNFLESDVQVSMHYRLTKAIAADLLPRLLGQCIEIGEVVMAWKMGWVVRCGAVDILIRHNIVSMVMCSTLDIEARTSSLEGYFAPSVLQQYIWSVLSPYLTLLDYTLNQYPHLYARIKIKCLGSCSKGGAGHEFYQSELVPSLDSELNCPRCREDGMTKEQVGYIRGARQHYLPFHDYRPKNDTNMMKIENKSHFYRQLSLNEGEERITWLCGHCGIRDDASHKLWELESSVMPASMTACLQHQKGHEQAVCGSVVTSLLREPGKQSRRRVLVTCSQPVYLSGMVSVSITVVREGSIKLIIAKPDYFSDHFNHDAKLKRCQLVHCIDTATLTKNSVKDDDSQTFDGFSCKAGDTFSIQVPCSELLENDGITSLQLVLQMRRNGQLFHTTHIPYRCIFGILLEPSETQAPSVAVSAPTFPMVRACHFSLGKALVYKTGLGNQWAVGHVVGHDEGLLCIRSSGSDSNTPLVRIPPNSPDLQPLSAFADGLTVIVDKEVLKSKEQLKSYLRQNECWPASHGLFCHLNSSKHTGSTLKLVKHEPKMCAFNGYSPQVLDMAYCMNLAETSQNMQSMKASYTHVYLPKNISAHILLHPMRQFIHSWTNQEIHFICNASSQFRDMHFLDMPAIEVLRVRFLNLESLLNAHHCLLNRKQEIIPELKKAFPNVEDLCKEDVVDGLKAILHVYKATFLLSQAFWDHGLFTQKITKVKQQLAVSRTEIKNLYEQRKAYFESNQMLICKCESHTLDEIDYPLLKEISQGLSENNAFLQYKNCITFLMIDLNSEANMEEGDIDMSLIWKALSNLPNLQYLCIPGAQTLQGVSACSGLISLKANGGHYTALPEDLSALKDSLETLDISDTPVKALPDFLCEFVQLKLLYFNNTLVTEFPKEIGNMRNLRKILAREALLSDLPESFGKLRHLEQLSMTGVMWNIVKTPRNAASQITMQYIKNVLMPINFRTSMAYKNLMTEEKWQAAFDEADVNEQKWLSEEGVERLNEILFRSFPRVGLNSRKNDKFGGFPPPLFKCRNLRVLYMAHHAMTFLPDEVCNLPQLKIVNFNKCPRLESLSIMLGKAPLRVLDVTNCPHMKTPPQEIIAQGKKTVIAYLKRLSQGSVKSYRTKLMFVGLGGAGKTSLMRALMSKDLKTPTVDGEGITDGIDISAWTPDSMLTYSVWDFAGQTVYYNTHQFFMSRRAVYVLVWNTRLGYEHSGLEFWMSSIACHCPESPVFIVGSHADQITNPDLPADYLTKRFSNITGFHTVSSHTGQGIKEFRDKLINVTMDQPYIGEMIPEAWLSFERQILSARNEGSLLEWRNIEKLAKGAGIYGSEVKQAVQFLDEMGTLQYFNNVFLRSRVVINPQWIVDVMACIVSVHNKVIQNGRLKHADIGKIWKAYSKELHGWLLRLTEVFDLTFPLDEKRENIVPCLLPPTEPDYYWPDVEEDDTIKETKMLYKFAYLPAGLFNRAQVRLYQFSDDTKLWKTGSVLQKNGHYCLLKQINEQEVLVKACGPKPENILLLVHEIFEGLISEFFTGVKYEYHIPCSDCVKTGTTDPAMFSSVVLRRAIDMKAFFLQCHTFFHTLSLTELQSIIPPQSGGDFEIQMQNAVRELGDLEENIKADVFFLMCQKNIPEKDEKDTVHPAKIRQDLENRSIVCWYHEDIGAKKPEEIDLALRTSKLVVILISDEFVVDELCQSLFYTVNRMKKEFILLMVGKERKWMNSPLGGIVTGKVFINFQRVNQYDDKIIELRKAIEERLGMNVTPGLPKPDVFVSYCWSNSKSAIDMGHARSKDGSVGQGDPRDIKIFLEKHGMPCWIDYQRVGKMGLFDHIAEGMKQAKVIVAFISDEYVMSDNCQMEFRFAHIALRKPIILAVVGTGYKWESTEIGMLALGYPKINFQVNNNTSYQDLLVNVQEVIASARAKEEKNSRNESAFEISKGTSAKEKAFQELFEMAQRKFLRQISGYTEDMDPFPRLFVADFNYDQIEKKSQDKDEITAEDIQVDTSDTQPTFVVDDLRQGQFCIKLLCEYETHWHAIGTGYPIDLGGDDLVQVWELAAPFMARILAILKHSSLHLHIINTPEGNKLLSMLEQKAGIEFNELLKPLYNILRKFVMAKEAQTKQSNLKRCHMPSGKYLWLCGEHQQLPRVTVMEEEEETSKEEEISTSKSPEYVLLQELRALASTTKDKNISNDGVADEFSNMEKQRPKSRLGNRRMESKTPRKSTTVAQPPEQTEKVSVDTTNHPESVLQSALDQPKDNSSVKQETNSTEDKVSEPGSIRAETQGTAELSAHKKTGSASTRQRKTPMSEEDRKKVIKRTSAQNMAAVGYHGDIETSRACVIL